MKYKRNVILLVIVGIIVLFFALKDDFDEIMRLLLNANKMFILVAILFVLISDILKSIAVKKLIINSGYDCKLKDSLTLMIMTNFFNGITPFSLGGQPFELFVMKKKKKIGYVAGTNILFRDFYTYQMAFVILGVLCFIFGVAFKWVIFSPIVIRLLIIALIINLAVALFLVYIPHSKKDNYKIVNYIINILSKIKIVKDSEKTIEKVDNAIVRFKKQTRETINKPKIIIECILLNCIKIICIGVATYFSFKAIGSSIPFISTILIAILVMIMSSYVPIPGASGGMEYSFVAMFSFFVINAKLSAALLLWRFLTYYVPMIFGGVVFITLKGD